MNSLEELGRAMECEESLRELIEAVLRIGWDRDVRDVKELATKIELHLFDTPTDAPLAAREMAGETARSFLHLRREQQR